MRILIIGSDYVWSIERKFRFELINLGHIVDLMPVQNYFYDYYYKSILNKIFFRLNISGIYVKINNRILSHINDCNYDLVWVFKGMEINCQTLLKLRDKGIKIINFNPDNPFIFSSRGSGNKNVIEGLPYYDTYLTYDTWVMNKINSDYNVPCSLIPFGFDEKIITEDELEEVKEEFAVCFIGNPDSHRSSILKKILAHNIKLHIYGNDWEKYISDVNVTLHGPVYGKDLLITLRKFRVQLNLMRIHNLNSHNMRSIEIPGAGGIMLAPITDDHKLFFEIDKEIFLYDDNSLIDQIERILSLPLSQANDIRNSARKKVLCQFTYRQIVLEVLKDL